MVTLARRTLAVLLGVLVVTAPMTTVAAAGVTSSPTPADGTSGIGENPTNDTRTLPANASAFAYRVAAYEQLTRAANQSTKRQPKLRKFREELNRSFKYHRDRHRVSDRAVFQTDKQAAAALAEHHPRVAAWLVDADQRLATTAVTDAERVLATLSNRSGSFDRARATDELRKARRALQQGDRLHATGNGAAAIAHYRQAWTHAQTALDVLDAGVGPTVTVTNRSDSVRNGSANYTVRGTVFAVQPGEIDAVTVVVNGEPREVRIRPGTVPGSTRRFAATVRLDARVVNLTVVASEPEDGQPGRSEHAPGKQSKGKKGKKADKGVQQGNGNGNETGPDDPGSDGTGSAVQTDRAVLFLDGDGLPDRYETATTSTDPLNPDSDAGATGANEAGDGTHDGLADYDGDGLVTLQERTLTTDPLDPDTDDDRLSDRAEVVWTDTDPLTADSDGDGVSDAREDPDDDTLVNVDEIPHDADPHRADTDGDGLRDPDEVDVGTKPAVFDTDADGLGDDAELGELFNTDPLDPDTDGDGILDGNETYTTQAANESVGAAVSLTGEGNAARSVTIHNRTGTFQSGGVEVPTASSVVDIEARENFSTATVSLQYDAARFSDAEASDLAVFRYDPTLQTFVKLDSEVDTANHTVTAETSHFSVYTVIPTSEWASGFDSGLPSPWSVEKAFDYLGTWTCSGSCLTEDSTLIAGDIGSGGGGVTALENNSSDGIHVLCRALPGWEDCDVDDDGIPNGEDPCPEIPGTECDENSGGGGGGGGDPEPTQHTEVTRTYRFDHAREITVQLRVKGSVSESDSAVYVELGDQRVFTIDTVTSTGWRTITRDVTEYAGGDMTVRVVADNQSVVQVDSFKIKKHSDLDSIPDNVEEEGMPVGWGFEISTDPHDADDDGDGLFDDEEIFVDRVRTNPFTGERYYGWRSNPTLEDTDDDGLDDGPEVWGTTIPITTTANGEPLRYASDGRQAEDTMHVDSNPLFADTDDDGLTDAEERALHTDPREQVTYAVTERHQRRIVDELYDRWKRHDEAGRYGEKKAITASATVMGLLPDGKSARSLGDLQLTDATGDFDFVTTDRGELEFVALDNERRTDTWLSNQRELGYTDPWDPDTDNDGLTDGQEVKGLTLAKDGYVRLEVALNVVADSTHTYRTSPTDADSDEDGYWDGWLGVYGVENSRNVILYMEHLRNDGGLAPGERVPAQAGTHDISKAPSAMGADVDRDESKEHANIHVGELQWGANPDDPQDIPTPELSVEVDYYAGAEYQPLDTGTWEDGIEDNYALYGIDVDIVRDDVLTDDDFVPCIDTVLQPYCIEPDNGFGYSEIFHIGVNHESTGADEYVFVGHRAGGLIPNQGRQTGVNLFGVPYQGLFVQGNQNLVGRVPNSAVQASPYETEVTFVAAKTEIHEIGHALGAGELDDRSLIEDPVRKFTRNGEVYSGRLDTDPTDEYLAGKKEWSIMASGWKDDMVISPINGRYYAYSIEELGAI